MQELEDVSQEEKVVVDDVPALTTIQKVFLYPLFIIVLICSIIMVYLSMVVLITLTIPTIIMLFTIIMSHSTLKTPLETFSNVAIVIILYPLFTLLMSTIWKMMCSFLQEFWSNVMKLVDLKTITKRLLDPTTNFFYMITQLIIFVVFYITVFTFLVINIITQESKVANVLLALDLVWAFYGIATVICHSWKVFIFPAGRNISLGHDATESHGKWFRLVLPIEVLDPANLRKQDEWIELLNDNRTNEFVPSSNNKLLRIPGTIVGALNIAEIILLIYLPFTDEKQRNFINYILPVICFLCFPLSVMVPLSIPLYKREKFNDQGSLKLLLTVMTAFYAVLIFCILVFYIIMGVKKDFVPPPIKYKANFTKYTVPKHKPSFCQIKFNEYDIIQLSVLNAACLFNEKEEEKGSCKQKNGTRTSYINTLKYVFGENVDGRFSHRCFDSTLGTSIFYYRDEHNIGVPFVLAKSIQGSTNWAAFIETFLQQYIPSILSSIIPFYSIVSSVFSSFMTTSILIMQKIFMAVPLVDGITTKVYKNIKNNNKSKGYFVGHSIGSYVLKQVALMNNYHGFVFEGLPLYETANALVESVINVSVKKPKANANVLSFFSDSSLLGGYDQLFKTNIQLPNIKSSMDFLNEIDSACMIAALCSSDDRWVPYCEQALDSDGKGVENYRQMREVAAEYA